MSRLHRNNAAEWVMVVALAPIAWVLRGRRSVRGQRKGRDGGKDQGHRAGKKPSGSGAGSTAGAPPKPPRRPVMIEGLPPRTMN